MKGLITICSLILVLFLDFHTAININPEQISAVVKEFGNEMEKIVVNFTALRYFNQHYTKYGGGVEELDGRSLVNEIAGDISAMLKRKIAAVKELVRVAQEANAKHSFDEMIDYDYLNNKKLLSDDDLVAMNLSVANASKTYTYLHLSNEKEFNGEMVNFDLSTVHVPTNVFDKAPVIQNGVKWSEKLDDQFKKNHRDDKASKWQYFCSSDGFFRVYPGMKWPKNNTDGRIDTFDCRIRSWYIKAATAPKNILILVDMSGSMKGLRMKITHSTIEKILQTLSDEDRFNIIKFTEEPYYLDEGCTNNTLIHASKINKRRMMEKVKEIEPQKKANFSKALIEAFELFQSEESKLSNQSDILGQTKYSEGKLCNKAIMLITDGAPESYEKVFDEYNWKNNKSVRVFTFLIGREVSDNRYVKWIADANRGNYTHISTLADVQEHVQEYIKRMSIPLALSQTENHVWTSLDADYVTEVSPEKEKGLQFITSFSAPVYDTRENYTKNGLIGVAGTDVTVKQIQDLIPYTRLGPNSYAFVVTHQGYVLFHPNFQPIYNKEDSKEYHPDFQNVDITEVEYAQDKDLLNEMRQKLINGKSQEHISMVTKMPYGEGMVGGEVIKRRIALRNYTFYFSKIYDTDFSLGIALAQKKAPRIAYYKDITKTSFKKNDNTEIAPWHYCKQAWTDSTDLFKIFKKKFSENETKGKGCSDYSDSFLLWDLSTEPLDRWARFARYHATGSQFDGNKNLEDIYKEYGIEQLFFWTSAGVIKYIQASKNISEPKFIENNIKTITNPYFRQAQEGVENGYNFTYSVPFYQKIANSNDRVVTITAPIYPKGATVAVVGLQMKYKNFKQKMEDVITREAVPLTRYHQVLSCKDYQRIHCYILDSNGYIVYDNSNDQPVMTGKLLYDVKEMTTIDDSLMDELVKRKFFKEEMYENSQVMCQRRLNVNKENSASFILNPFKKMLNLIFWMFTEMVIFSFEFQWSWFTERHTASSQKVRCYKYKELDNQFNLSEMPKNVFNHMLNMFPLCDNVEVPCVSTHKRFRTNFQQLKRYYDNVPFSDTLSDCQNCRLPIPCIPDCNRTYTVQWIKDTNLMFVAVDAPGNCSMMCSHRPVTLDDEYELDEEAKCETLLKENERTKTRKSCVDFHPDEPDTRSGQRIIHTSCIVLAVSLFLGILTNQNCV